MSFQMESYLCYGVYGVKNKWGIEFMLTGEKYSPSVSEDSSSSSRGNGGLIGDLCREMAKNQNVMTFSEMGKAAASTGVAARFGGAGAAVGAGAGIIALATTKAINAAIDFTENCCAHEPTQAEDLGTLDKALTTTETKEHDGAAEAPAVKESTSKFSGGFHKLIEDPPGSGKIYEYTKEDPNSGIFQVKGPDGKIGYAHWLPQKWPKP
jgi:hypothetical protein